MRHVLAGRPADPDTGPEDLDREYELSERQAEALLDDGVIEPCERSDGPGRAVYRVAPEFDDAYPDPAELWGEIEERLRRIGAAEAAADDGTHVLVLATDVELRPLSEAERLEDDGVIYPDKYFGGERRTIYHVAPGFAERAAPEPVAKAIEEQLDPVLCRRRNGN